MMGMFVLCVTGKVYNVTPYMEFHPGGEEELMRGAGMDGTVLFDEVIIWHIWYPTRGGAGVLYLYLIWKQNNKTTSSQI